MSIFAHSVSHRWERNRIRLASDDEAVRETCPQSVTATSWLARDWLINLARTNARDSVEDGPPVAVGGFVFEAHPPKNSGKNKSNESRGRWVLLALSLDLEERLCHHALTYRQQPVKLTVGWHAAGATGWDREGLGMRSRTVTLPNLHLDELVDGRGHGEGSGGSGSGSSPVAGSEVMHPSGQQQRVSVPFAHTDRASSAAAISAAQPESATLFVDVPHEQQQALLSQPGGYGKRVSAIVKAAATCLAAWAAELPSQRVSQLTLSAHAFVNIAPPSRGLRAMLARGVQKAADERSTDCAKDATASTDPLTAAPNVLPPPEESEASPPVLPPAELPRDDAERGDGWGCRRCTLINTATAPRCEACDEPRLLLVHKRAAGAAAGAGAGAGPSSSRLTGGGAGGKKAKPSGTIDRFVLRHRE